MPASPGSRSRGRARPRGHAIQTRVTEARRGLAHGIAAYALWGMAPLFWNLVRKVAPSEILAHVSRAVHACFARFSVARPGEAPGPCYPDPSDGSSQGTGAWHRGLRPVGDGAAVLEPGAQGRAERDPGAREPRGACLLRQVLGREAGRGPGAMLSRPE